MLFSNAILYISDICAKIKTYPLQKLTINLIFNINAMPVLESIQVCVRVEMHNNDHKHSNAHCINKSTHHGSRLALLPIIKALLSLHNKRTEEINCNANSQIHIRQ